MRHGLFCSNVLILLVWSSTCEAAPATPIVIDSLKDLQEALKSAAPGAVFELADGVYDLHRDVEIKRVKGTEEAPVTVRAQHRGQVEFRGEHVFKVRHCEHLVLEGFRFRLKADVHGKSGAVSVRYCNHCRITRNNFELDELDTGDGNQVWLAIDGHGSGFHRIDRNRFANKAKEGHFIFVTGEDDYVSQHDVIERNHFVNRQYGNDANEYESIRVGESHIGNRDGKSYTVIRENLFERCQGEDELVSFKVGGCSFLDNTVKNCHGCVVFRDGSDGVFAGNFVISDLDYRPFEAYRAGGVRFYGSGHRAYNNYFEGLNGTSAKAPLALMHGAPAASGALGVADGLPATNCIVVHNTWKNCAQLRLGFASKKRPLKPNNCIFANNIVSETEDSQLLELFEAEDIACRDNILYATRGKETGIEGMDYSKEAFLLVDPRLRRGEAIYRIQADSPAIDAASERFSFVEKDLDDAPRDRTPDIGADEYVPADEHLRGPLDATVVGVGANE